MMKRAFSLFLVIALMCGLLITGTAIVSAVSETDVAYPVEGGSIYFDNATGTITDCDETVTSADIPAEIDGVPVTSIGDSAFYYCRSLTNVTIPDSVTSLGDSAFACCYSLTNVTIPDSFTSIGEYAFYDCSSLTSVTIPESVTSIGEYAFACCDNLTNVTIPDSVTSIGDYAFAYCDSLTNVTISDKVISIGDSAFVACSSLSGFGVDAANQFYCNDEFGVLFNKEQTELIQCPGAFSGDYSIPGSVTSIGISAFEGCSGLTNVTIPNSVTSIDDFSFAGCYNLTSVTIPDSVTRIGASAFWHCISLTSVTIPGSVTSIGDSTFYDCSSLTSVTIPGSVTSIGDEAFYGCSSLTNVTIPNGVTTIGGYAFGFCDNMTSVTFPDSVASIGVSAFWHCISLTSVTIPDSVTNIGNSAFESCSGLTNVTISNSLTSIDAYTFAGCDSLISVTIPNSVKDIAYQAFDGCSSLSYIYYTGTKEEWAAIMISEGNAPVLEATIHYNFKPMENPFTDVKDTDYFAAPVAWAVENGITNGVSATEFAPEASCTRGQIVTFLWRAQGCPEPSSNANPFTDIKADAYYYKAVLWAVENGITSGMSATTFEPETTCTRAQAATFIWRANGKPTAESKEHPFTDIVAGEYYYDAVLWAVENGITNGFSATEFAPAKNCTRAQIVTFLYRALAK